MAPEPRPRGADSAGQLLVTIALATLTAALIDSGNDGWGAGAVLIPLGVAVVSGAAFIANERRARPRCCRSRCSPHARSPGGTAVGLCINLGLYGELFVMTLYLQQLRGYSPALAGLALLPQMGLLTLGSALSGRMSARSGRAARC